MGQDEPTTQGPDFRMTQDFEEAIDEWDDIIEEAAPVSEVETGSELDEAIRRKAIADKELGIVPPHGPRAYKRASAGNVAEDVRDVTTDEVLFDDGADWRAQPTMRIMFPPPDAIEAPEQAHVEQDAPRSNAPLVVLVITALVAASAVAFYALDQQRDVERLEQHIRMQLEATE
jgi:hypothetical protein